MIFANDKKRIHESALFKRKALFEIAKGKSTKKFVEQFISRPWHKNLKRTFFGVPNVKEQYIETQEMIKASLNDGFVCLPDFHMGRAIVASNALSK